MIYKDAEHEVFYKSCLERSRLAFNLYSGSTPTICLYEENEEDCLQECSQYAVSDIFSRSICNMEYLMEAVRLRYQSDFENKVKEEIL